MPGTRRCGIDNAIALLLALTRCGGQGRASDLAKEIGAPRASFYRIVQALASAGLIQCKRGKVEVGPLAEILITANREAVLREDLRRTPWTGSWTYHKAAAEGRVASATSPIALSPPLPRLKPGRLRIGFSNASMDNPWRVALVHSVEHAAANLADRIDRLIIRHAGDDAKKQASDIEDLISAGVDGLVVSAAASKLVGDAVALAMESGVPTVIVDRGVGAGVPYTSFVTTDDRAIGHITALWLAEKLGGRGSILLLPGLEGAEPACLRFAAARSVFARFPGIGIAAVRWTAWHADTAYRIVSDILRRRRKRIDAVWCDSGLQGAGSLQAFIDAGFRPGAIPPHTGGDLNLVYKLALRYRTPLAAVDFPPAMGLVAVETLAAALRGQWVPKIVDVASDVILTKGAATSSVRATIRAEDHVRWDLPDDLILATGLGPNYDPHSFRVHYPGNIYNRSAAIPMRT